MQSGSILWQTFFISATTSSIALSSQSRTIFCAIKSTVTLFTPLIFAIPRSIFAAQFAQSKSSSLITFFIFLSPLFLSLACGTCGIDNFIVLVFAEMFHRHFINARNMLVVERIKNLFTGSACLDDLCLAKCAQLMRNRRFRHAQNLGNVAHA